MKPKPQKDVKLYLELSDILQKEIIGGSVSIFPY
jgi:hypothetical protein